MRELENLSTQPFADMPVFGNWDVIAEAWYFVCPSSDLKGGKVKSFKLCGQRIVLFRGADGVVRALDAYCPHMGTDLAIGTVVGNHLRCFFHHWEFNGNGACAKIPCQDKIPAGASLRSYAVEEKYASIWVYPAEKAPGPVPSAEGFEGAEVVSWFGKPCTRSCHYHVGMINGLDAQHLKTVHDLNIKMELSVQERDRRVIDFVMGGEIPTESLSGKVARFFMGPRYEYAMRYAEGSIGILTLVRGCRFLGKALPRLYMLYAYRPDAKGLTFVQPIYFTRRRAGAFGKLKEWTLMFCTMLAYRYLQDEDAKIYENIRFNPTNLLGIDQAVGRIIGFVNNLKPSIWSGKDQPWNRG